jgi:hypothetical protein
MNLMFNSKINKLFILLFSLIINLHSNIKSLLNFSHSAKANATEFLLFLEPVFL